MLWVAAAVGTAALATAMLVPHIPRVATRLGGFFSIGYDMRIVGAASNGDTDEVSALLARGYNPNATHLEGSSALSWAVAARSLPTVRVLLNHGADPNLGGQWSSCVQIAVDWIDSSETPSEKSEARTVVRLLLTHGVDLREEDLSRADLRDLPLQDHSLRGCDLTGTRLENVDFGDADLRGANLRGADLTDAALDGAKYDLQTKWPAGFDPQAAGAVLVE